MGKLLKQYSGAIISLLFWGGLEVSPYESLPLAIVLWSVAGLWAIIATILWIKHIRNAPNELAETRHENYVDKIIIDSKVPAVLEITNTLQKMADYQNIILNKLLNKKIKKNKLAKIQKAVQTRLQIKSRDPHLGNEVKIQLIKKQMKRMGLYTDYFGEEHVQFMVELSWVLHDCGVGIPQYLDDMEYEQLKTLLNTQTHNIAGDNSEEMILIYQDLVLGFNSMIAYTSYFPKSERDKIPYEMQKSLTQLKHEREQVLKTYLQKLSKELEGELCGKR